MDLDPGKIPKSDPEPVKIPDLDPNQANKFGSYWI
jgi:hypothetical protein